eukprot:GHVU01092013.1.p1 GENE.GHVU01092013.1~~GHVU01092013.1.p1  ORF type:complete len:372 (+),score=49.56 GHVU01092013.1:124-1116(+)
MADRNLAVSKIKGLLHAPRLGGGGGAGGGGGEEPTPTANSKFDGSPTAAAAAADRRGRGSSSYYSFNNGATTDGAGSSRSTPRSVRGDFSHGDDMQHGNAAAAEQHGNDWWSQRGGRTRSSSRSTTRSSARGGGAGSTSRRNRHRENSTGCVAVGSVNRKMPTLWHSATAPPHGLTIAAPPSYRSSPSRPQTWRTTQPTDEASCANQSSAYPLTCSRLNEHDNLRSQQDGDEASLDADKWTWNPINKYRQRLHGGGGEDDGSGRGGDCAMSACSGASQCTMYSGIASIRTQASSLRQQLKPSSHSFPALMSMVPFTPQFSPSQPGSARSC